MVDVTFQKPNGKCSLNFASELRRKGLFVSFFVLLFVCFCFVLFVWGAYVDSQKCEDYFSYHYSQDLPCWIDSLGMPQMLNYVETDLFYCFYNALCSLGEKEGLMK